jgi:hypothetical protein
MDERDPELDWMREVWSAPNPPPGLAAKLLARYRSESRRRTRWWLSVPAIAAAVLAAFFFFRPSADDFRVVAKPHLVVVSQGETP